MTDYMQIPYPFNIVGDVDLRKKFFANFDKKNSLEEKSNNIKEEIHFPTIYEDKKTSEKDHFKKNQAFDIYKKYLKISPSADQVIEAAFDLQLDAATADSAKLTNSFYQAPAIFYVCKPDTLDEVYTWLALPAHKFTVPYLVIDTSEEPELSKAEVRNIHSKYPHLKIHQIDFSNNKEVLNLFADACHYHLHQEPAINYLLKDISALEQYLDQLKTNASEMEKSNNKVSLSKSQELLEVSSRLDSQISKIKDKINANINITANDVALFKASCKKIVEDNRQTFSTHRSHKYILANVALAVATFGVGYLAALSIKALLAKRRGDNADLLFFSKTKSQKIAESLVKSLQSNETDSYFEEADKKKPKP